MKIIENLNSVYEKLNKNLCQEEFEISINSDSKLVLVKQKNSQYLGELTKNCLLTFTFGFHEWQYYFPLDNVQDSSNLLFFKNMPKGEQKIINALIDILQEI